MVKVILGLTRRRIWSIIFCVMITGVLAALTGCKKGKEEKIIEKCGDLEVMEKILQRADIKVEGHEVKVQKNLCLHKFKVKDKTLVVYYMGGFYFVGLAFDEKGMPIGVEE